MVTKLFPEFKDNLWGGKKLIDRYGKDCEKEICAESWELSFHPAGPTKISGGKLLSEIATPDVLGANASIFENFPLMIKLIDARDNLSVQVHPSDDYALKHENSYGKTEMWYILEADEGAGIYLGFKKDVTEDEVFEAINKNSLTDLMNFFEVKAGDCYFIPSGTIHAIGTGCLIYEIQQNSNLTYRVYDYGRRDKDGNTRELHIEKALRVLNFEKYTPSSPDGDLLGISKYFTARKLLLSDSEMTFERDEKSFRCVTITSGDGFINGLSVSQGDSYFIPATEEGFTLSGNMTAILAELRRYGYNLTTENGKYTAELYDDLQRKICSFSADSEKSAIDGLFKMMNITDNDITL